MTVPLRVEALTKRYGDRTVLDALSVTVEPGEILTVLGPNGAGKSTLLGCVVGTVIPDAGAVEIGGLSPREEPVRARAAFRYVPQEADLPEGVTGREVLRVLGHVFGAPGDVERAARMSGLGDQLSLLASTYSVGMRRRLQLAAIAIGKPALLVLDEPFAGLDADGRAGLLEAIGSAGRRGAGVLVAAHDLDRETLEPLGPRELQVGQ